jgi:hypothetical protein
MQRDNTILNLKAWANWATSLTEASSKAYNDKRLTGQEAKDMVNFLAGYMGASAEGKKVLAEILKL